MLQRRAALALTIAMIAVPGVPTLLVGLLDTADGEPDSTPPTATAATESEAEFIITAPNGWQVEQLPNRAVLRSGDASVVLEVHDRDGRGVAQLAERLMRMDRVRGVSAAYDGGRTVTGDGALTGETCVVTTADSVGTCAVLADDDVVVLVQSRGTAAHPALALDAVLADLERSPS